MQCIVAIRITCEGCFIYDRPSGIKRSAPFVLVYRAWKESGTAVNQSLLPIKLDSCSSTRVDSKFEKHFPQLARRGYAMSQLSDLEDEKLHYCLVET